MYFLTSNIDSHSFVRGSQTLRTETAQNGLENIFKLTNDIQSFIYVLECGRLLLCFWRLIAGRWCSGLKMFLFPL